MTEKVIRLGFIGCGRHAREHAHAVLLLPDLFSVVAAYDTSKDALVRFSKIADPFVREARSAEEVIHHPDVDAVIIATPPEFHFDLMQQVVAAGKHVLCEKPLWVGDRAEAMYALLSEGRKKHLVVTSCHSRRFTTEFVHLRTLLPTLSPLGALLEFNFRFFRSKPRTVGKTNYSLLLDHLTHEVDVMHYVLGHAPFHLTKLVDSPDIYKVTGERGDGIHIFFLGVRALRNRASRNELELVFENGRVVTVGRLENGILPSSIITMRFDDRSESIHHLPPSRQEDVLAQVMRNFGETIRGQATNYLREEDLIVNNAACNELVLKGAYHYTPRGN